MHKTSTKLPLKAGYSRVVSPQQAGGLKFIEFGLLFIEADSSYKIEVQAGYEQAIVLLYGSCQIAISKSDFVEHCYAAERSSPFLALPYAVYLPPESSVEIKATGKNCELASAKATIKNGLNLEAPIFIAPQQVKLQNYGQANWQRQIRSIIGEDIPAKTLIIGETINPPGNWSSYPPHKHDELTTEETKLEEVYHFRVNPEVGFGYQRIYGDGFDELYVVQNYDTIIIPCGYHPVVAAPGYEIYYLWVLAGEVRKLKPRFDERHSWILNECPKS